MAIALDYTSRIDPAALQAAGVTVVCRYLSWLYRWGGQTHSTVNPKIIQGAEYRELVSAGLDVVLNWEYDPRDWLGGSPAAKLHAAEAVRQAQILGYPTGSVIVGSADFDMTRAQWDAAAAAYAASFEAGIRAAGYVPGVYGPYDVLTWCHDDTGVRFFWQAGMSTSWSQGRNRSVWPGAHLCQRGYKTVGGVAGDWNDILRPWEAGMAADVDDIIRRWSEGDPEKADGSELSPVAWRIRDEKWQASVDGELADLKAAVAALGSGGVDVDALANDVATKIGAAIVKALAGLAAPTAE